MNDENLRPAIKLEAAPEAPTNEPATAPHFSARAAEMPFLPPPRLSALCEDFLTICRMTPQTEAQQYLAQCGLDSVLLRRAGLAYFPLSAYETVQRELHACGTPEELQQGGFCDAEGRLRFLRHRLLFPFYSEGRALYLQARAIAADVSPVWHKLRGPVPSLYGLDTLAQLSSESYVYLVQGLMDALTLRAHGFHAVAQTGNDDDLRPVWLPLLARFQVVAALKQDAAGTHDLARYRALFASRGLLLPNIALATNVNQFFAARPTAALEWAILTDAAVNG